MCALLMAFLAACAVVETTPPDDGAAPAPPTPTDPVLVAAPIAPAREAEAADLFARAQAAFEAGRYAEALEASSRVVEQFPAAAVSGRALMLQARAALEAGDGQAADAAAARYIGLVPAGDSRVAELRLLQGEALAGNPAARIDRLLRLGAGAEPEQTRRAVELARESVDELALDELDTALAETPEDGPVRPVVEARRAALLLSAGATTQAESLARAALDHGASGADSVLAVSVLRGELPDGYVTVTRLALGAVLPLDGAPALAAFAEQVLEGIEVAAATALGSGFEVDLEVRDDAGDPEQTARLVAELEAQGVSGVVGFLQDLTLEIAAGARSAGVPLVSPTARVASLPGEAVYSLEGVDPAALRDLARHAASQGFQRMAFIESSSELSRAQADAFAREAAAFGIPSVARFTYPEGATFFEEQIIAARNALRQDEIRALGLTEEDTLRVELLEPVAVFAPVPAEDVELLAPQIVHFGLDTLGIAVLGTSGWTDPQTLARVDQRHTDGVVATAPVGAGAESEGYVRFKEAYEEHFQRTLVSPVPAYGYDAALVLLSALRSGRTTPASVRDALETLDGVQGATGVFAVVDGRIVRRSGVVLIDAGNLIPIP